MNPHADVSCRGGAPNQRRCVVAFHCSRTAVATAGWNIKAQSVDEAAADAESVAEDATTAAAAAAAAEPMLTRMLFSM